MLVVLVGGGGGGGDGAGGAAAMLDGGKPCVLFLTRGGQNEKCTTDLAEILLAIS